MRSPIRAVVFDLDGLMVNTEEVFHLTGHELMRRRGQGCDAGPLQSDDGPPGARAFAAMIEMMELTETVDELQAESESVFDGLLEKHLCTMPGLIELLGHIEAQGLPKGVATSSDRVYLHRMLGQFDLVHRFPMKLTAEDVTHGKPNPEIYLKAAQRIGVDPHEMLVWRTAKPVREPQLPPGAHIISVPHQHSTPPSRLQPGETRRQQPG